MKIICAWCKKDMGEKAPEHAGISHGICAECAKRVKEESMAKRHEQKCECGNILKTAIELDTGICLVCLQRGECVREEPEPAVPVLDCEWERGSE